VIFCVRKTLAIVAFSIRQILGICLGICLMEIRSGDRRHMLLNAEKAQRDLGIWVCLPKKLFGKIPINNIYVWRIPINNTNSNKQTIYIYICVCVCVCVCVCMKICGGVPPQREEKSLADGRPLSGSRSLLHAL